MGEAYARFIENCNRRIGTTIGKFSFGMIWGIGAGMFCGLVAGAITFGGLATLIMATYGESIQFILSTLMISLVTGAVTGAMLGMFGGIIGMIIGLMLGLQMNQSLIDLAIRGGAIGGTIVSAGGTCLLISFLTQLD